MKPSDSARNVSVLICKGDLNANTMLKLKHSLTRLLQRKKKKLILDLAKARRADFSGLGILIERLQKIRAEQGDIRMIHVRPEIHKTFERTGISSMIESFDSKLDAIRSYRMV